MTISAPFPIKTPRNPKYAASIPAPPGAQLTAIFPNLGDSGGGQHVSIYSEGGMLAETSATIGGVACVDFVPVSDTMASAVTGPGTYSALANDVVVGSMTLTAGYSNWDPVSYFGSRLKGYWNANVLSSITFATGVSQLSDLSGNGHHMVQATGANQPTYPSNDQTIGGAGHLLWPSSLSNNVGLVASITLAEPYTIIWFGVAGSAGFNWVGNGTNVPYSQALGFDVMSNDGVGGQIDKKCYVGSAPLLTADVRNGAASVLYTQNSKSKKAGALAVTAITTLAMGNTPGGAGGLDGGRVGFMIAIAGTITDQEFEMIAKWVQSFAAAAHPAPDAQLLQAGNSFAVGALAGDWAVQGYAPIIAAGMPSHIQTVIDGESGQTTSAMMAGGQALIKGEASLAAKRVCGLQEIGNDIFNNGAGGVSGATAASNVRTWVASMIASGYLPYVTTEITRSALSGWTGAMETARLACNASLLSGATPIVGLSNWYLDATATFFIYDKDGALTSTQKDPTNTTWRGDGIHPTGKLHAEDAKHQLPGIRYVFSTLDVAA